MKRLNNEIREAIVKGITKETFGRSQEELKRKESSLVNECARYVYANQFPDMPKVVYTLKKSGLYSEELFMKVTNYRPVLHTKDRSWKDRMLFSSQLTENLVLPAASRSYLPEEVPEQFRGQFTGLWKERETLGEKIRQFRRQLGDALRGIRTMKQLEDRFPEGVKYVEDYTPAKQLPALTFDAIRQTMKTAGDA